MKVVAKRLRMGDGSIRKFKSRRARDDFERIAMAIKHGWSATRKKGHS